MGVYFVLDKVLGFEILKWIYMDFFKRFKSLIGK